MSGYRRDVPHGLMFHRFCAAEDESRPQGALTAADFERILQFVGPERLLAPAEWLDRLAAGELEPHHLCITFDDGVRSQHQHALPVLERHGLKAFWFVYSCVFRGQAVKLEVYAQVAARFGGMPALIAEFLRRAPRDLLAQLNTPEFAAYADHTRASAPFYSLDDLRYRFLRNQPQNRESFESLMDSIIRERGFEPEAVAAHLWLTDADLKSLSHHGHEIGLHSFDHPYSMAGLALDQQREQYRRNFEHVRAATGKPPRSMSHPLNSYNEYTLAVLRELGIQCGFRANMRAGAGGINPTPLELAREDSALLLQAAGA